MPFKKIGPSMTSKEIAEMDQKKREEGYEAVPVESDKEMRKQIGLMQKLKYEAVEAGTYDPDCDIGMTSGVHKAMKESALRYSDFTFLPPEGISRSSITADDGTRVTISQSLYYHLITQIEGADEEIARAKINRKAAVEATRAKRKRDA